MIFHVDLDAFFASIEQRDNPFLRGKPIIVGGPARHRGVVAAASYEARKYGIHSAMPLSKAFQLCLRLILIPPNFQKYTFESKRFYEILTSYTPYIEPASLDEAYLSLYGFAQYYGDFKNLGIRIRKHIQETMKITASIGIAKNKIVAKIASDRNKPNGLTYVPIGTEKTFLSRLPIRELPGLGAKTEERFKDLGIKTINQLAKMPKAKLAILFGKHGEYLWQTANGIDDSDVVTNRQRKSIGAETTFLYDSNNKDFVEQTLYLLILQVAFDLREARKKAKGLTIKLRTSSFKTQTHQEKLQTPCDNAKFLFLAAKSLLRDIWNGRSSLRLVGISTFDLLNADSTQQLLFDTLPKNQEHVDVALDRIRKKHGFWSIYPATLLTLAKPKNKPYLVKKPL